MPTERRCMLLDQWPAEDRRRWIEGLRTGGLFEAASAGACWAPQSRRKFQSGYGRWLTWLHTTGQLDNAVHPGDYVWANAGEVTENHDGFRPLRAAPGVDRLAA